MRSTLQGSTFHEELKRQNCCFRDETNSRTDLTGSADVQSKKKKKGFPYDGEHLVEKLLQLSSSY